jgi:anti-sigma regulatory factor (Ser/Thr protein kinase)
MDNSPFTSYSIEERSFVSYIKREINNLVKEHFSEKRTGEINIVVSELTSNLIKYAEKGELLYRMREDGTKKIFELYCLDNGPGIKHINIMMKDGVSSSRTLGHGLGSASRLSNFFQVYSQPGKGTVAYTMFCSEDPEDLPPEHEHRLSINAVIVSKPGEIKCGDGCYMQSSSLRLKVFLGDGLGHGSLAADAVKAAVSFLSAESRENNPSYLIREMHQAVKKTRGLVGTVLVMDLKNKTFNICGIGNIHTRISSAVSHKNLSPYNGIIGLNIPSTLNNTEMPLEKYQTIVMCSDGIRTNWELAQYPGILKMDPAVIAAVIYKDHARRTDDMSVVVIKTR